MKNYAYRADLAARKAVENAKFMANAKASGPTKERLNSSVAASNERYTVEQAEVFRKRGKKAMAESKQFADQAAQAQLLTKTIYDGPEQAVKEACENNVAALMRHSSEVAQANGVSAAEFTADVQCVEVTPWFDKQWGENWRKLDIALLFNAPISIRIAAWVLPQPDGLLALAVGMYDDKRTCDTVGYSLHRGVGLEQGVQLR